MRFDHAIHFYVEANGRYNPDTGKREAVKELVTTIYGNVTDMGIDRAVQVFGKYDHQSKVIRLETELNSSWSYLTIDDQTTKYRLQTDRRPLKGTTLIVGESNG